MMSDNPANTVWIEQLLLGGGGCCAAAGGGAVSRRMSVMAVASRCIAVELVSPRELIEAGSFGELVVGAVSEALSHSRRATPPAAEYSGTFFGK